MFVILLILGFIPQFNHFYPSTAYSIILLFGVGFGFFLFFVAGRIELSIEKKVGPLLRFSGLLAVSFFLFEIYRWIRVPKGYSLYTELGIQLMFYTLVVIFLVLGILNLFDYVNIYSKGKVKNIFGSIVDFKTTIALSFSLIFSYFTFGREIFSSVYPLPFHVDWLFISMITLVIGSGYYSYTNNNASKLNFPTKTENTVIYNDKMNRRLKLQKDFIKESRKDQLILYLLDLIVYQSKLMGEKEALDLLTPLIVYEEKPSPHHSFILSREKYRKEKEMRRKRMLSQVMMKIDETIKSEEMRIV